MRDNGKLEEDNTFAVIGATIADNFKVEMPENTIGSSPASYVKQASEYVDGKLLICRVIGFPNGYSTTAAKVFEAKDVKVKAAGGIATLDDAEKFISLGAERLGTSRLIKIIQNADNGFGY